MKQQICILGSTGSIGTQALDVISQHPDRYEAYCLTANNRWQQLAEQARRYHPAAVVIASSSDIQRVRYLTFRIEMDVQFAKAPRACQERGFIV